MPKPPLIAPDNANCVPVTSKVLAADITIAPVSAPDPLLFASVAPISVTSSPPTV